jgi:hypothetical protein
MEAAENTWPPVWKLQATRSLTTPTYRFANSMQTGHRKIPFPGGATSGVGTNYHWTQVLPLYEKELADFKAQVAELKNPKRAAAALQSPRGPPPNSNSSARTRKPTRSNSAHAPSPTANTPSPNSRPN